MIVNMMEVKDNMIFGSIDFNNCIVNDHYGRPFITFKDWPDIGKGVRDIQGNIAVYNPFGAELLLGEKTENGNSLQISKDFTLMESGDENIVVRLGSGNYSFRVKLD